MGTRDASSLDLSVAPGLLHSHLGCVGRKKIKSILTHIIIRTLEEEQNYWASKEALPVYSKNLSSFRTSRAPVS